MAFKSPAEYTIKTEQFEGPYAVLLELIESQELDITEISLSTVTQQFLDYIATHEQLPAQELADFLLVASKLLYIKAKAVLPKTIEIEESEGPSLESQLRMYKKYKDATAYIEDRVTDTRTSFFGKIKGPTLAQGFYPPQTLRVDDLMEAMFALIERLKPLIALPTVRVERVISINEKIEHIHQTLLAHARTSFKDIVERGNRADAIVGFLAILEMVKNRAIGASQARAFEDILIERI